MVKTTRIVWALAAVWVCCALWPAATAAADDRVKIVKGRFVKLFEKKIGEREYIALSVRVGEDGEATACFSRDKHDLMESARKLKANQPVTLRYVVEAGQNWLTVLETRAGDDRREDRRREGDGEKRDRLRRDGEGDAPKRDKDRDVRREEPRREGRPVADMRDLSAKLNVLLQRMERLEVEVRRLRGEVDRLKGRREDGEKGRDKAEALERGNREKAEARERENREKREKAEALERAKREKAEARDRREKDEHRREERRDRDE